MQKIGYFTITTHRLDSRDFLLRLVVLHDAHDHGIDHYYEYGAVIEEEFTLDDSLWSSDPEALLDYFPSRFQFMASMDWRRFQRNDLHAALDGSLMADDVEIVDTQVTRARIRTGTRAPWARRASLPAWRRSGAASDGG